MGRLGIICALGITLTLSACTDPGMNECPTDVLAGAVGFEMASCADGVDYEGETLSVECASVHETRIGERFLDDGGETEYTGARKIRGFPSDEVLILEGGHECRRQTQVAVRDDFGGRDYSLLALPVSTAYFPAPSLGLSDHNVRSGTTITLSIGVPERLRWGPYALLQRKGDGGWRSLYRLETDPEVRVNGYRRVSPGRDPLVARSGGFRGNRILRVALPDAAPGRYRISMGFRGPRGRVTGSVSLTIR